MNRRVILGLLCPALVALIMLSGAALQERGLGPRDVQAGGRSVPVPNIRDPAVLAPTPGTGVAELAPGVRSFAVLQAEVAQMLQSAGASGGVTLIELAGGQPQSWSLNGHEPFIAASTYKLPVLMKDSEDIASGRASPGDVLCFDPGDWEDGYFTDYAPGSCFTRAELDHRVGVYSDNTAAHILVRYGGGSEVLNAYARAHGATESAFYEPNITTAGDLARLWEAEAEGKAGGAAAQSYLYPLLTSTKYEEGIPDGVPSGEIVVHKVGFLDGELNDVALVEGGPHGPYVLAVCTEGGSWQLIADIAHAIDQFEAS